MQALALRSDSVGLPPQPADRIDVLLCENDVLAFGAMDVSDSTFNPYALRMTIAVAGFDNTLFASAPAYDLTTYEQPIEAMVKATVSMILGRKPNATVILSGRLIVRGSA
ncbi:hypothetical protein AU467_34065 [Mesorhizobium loti]|uniref:LacI family transcriptional regulator n=1 Tax=Rhizobium loti TaxID=381 RepID=A0A101KLQ1_RHILI|nr:hypothetical protein AU467_34065 [Mesorhizobium loti]